jgi:Flp pilus assembly protein TadD
MNKFCIECGAKLEQALKFCTECGHALEAPNTSTASDVSKISTNLNTTPKTSSSSVVSINPAVAKESTFGPQDEKSRAVQLHPDEGSKGAPQEQTNKVKQESSTTPRNPYPAATDVATKESSGKSSYVIIGVMLVIVIGGAWYFFKGGSAPQANSEVKTEKSLPRSGDSKNAPNSAAAQLREPPAVTKAPDAAEVLKLVMAMVDSVRAKDEVALQKALESIKALPVPRRGDRSAARAANTAGLAKIQSNEIPEAIAIFREGFAADPQDVEVVNNLGYVLSLAGNEIEAIDTFAKAISLAPDRASAWANLAVSFAKTNQLENGIAAYLLVYKFSKSQEKTRSFLVKQSSEAKDERERVLYQKVLEALDQQ